ncbi:MAG: 2-dehydro-3-deoxy-6-phosphogalactonate aldolase [Gammaproteobacteria bacterium]|nr:2-dehydro-3-deoxy-6-phosphogalactonate aldolase [Gammaproteobacteria bacterium]
MTELTLAAALQQLPLVAILRGVTTQEVLAIAKVIKAAGFGVIEVPLNSPDPYASIKLLADSMGDEVLIGAGTVLDCEQVDRVAAAGGRLIISPHADTEVIAYSKQQGLYSVPGFYTPTEAFAAIKAGADALKLFPADTLGAQGLKAMTAVLPPAMPILPVGGVAAESGCMGDFLKAGAKGFGLGSGLYKAGMSVEAVQANAEAYVTAWQKALLS